MTQPPPGRELICLACGMSGPATDMVVAFDKPNRRYKHTTRDLCSQALSRPDGTEDRYAANRPTYLDDNT